MTDHAAFLVIGALAGIAGTVLAIRREWPGLTLIGIAIIALSRAAS